jgi:replication factor A1
MCIHCGANKGGFGCVPAQVILQGDGYWCEQDSKSYETMERRYVLRLKAADCTGEAFLAVFNDQARAIVDSAAPPSTKHECKRFRGEIASLLCQACQWWVR